MTRLANKKILEVENLLQTLSDEMLKLKSAAKNYEETKENLQKMCESIDKISTTHQKLTTNMTQFLDEMESMILEGKNTREFIQKIHDETKSILETKARQYEEVVEASLARNQREIRDEFGKQTDKIVQQSESQSKALRLMKYLITLGVVIEAVIIVLLLLLR